MPSLRDQIAEVIGKTFRADSDGCPVGIPDMVDAILALPAIAGAKHEVEVALDIKADAGRAWSGVADRLRARAERAEAGWREAHDALADLVFIINAAGLRNLTNGVQLGQTSWYVWAREYAKDWCPDYPLSPDFIRAVQREAIEACAEVCSVAAVTHDASVDRYVAPENRLCSMNRASEARDCAFRILSLLPNTPTDTPPTNRSDEKETM